jgi:hypothetical protein
MELFYAPENLAPLIKSIDVDRPELGDGEREPSPSVTIKWSVDSRDDDELIYDVRVRPEGGGEPWVKLNSGDKLVTKHEYSWDLSTVPDGVYEVEIVASDEPSNGTAKARKDGLISDPVIVDRQRPTIASVTIKGRRLTGTAQDRGSYIHDVAFSLDNDAFRSASPQDGLFDGTSEAFVLDLPDDLTPGQHRLVIRARDAFGNIGTFPMVIKG